MKSDSANLAKKTITIGIVVVILMTVFVGMASATPEGWSDDIQITTTSEASLYPTIVTDSNNNVHISWQDNRDGNPEIYYTKLNSSGNILIDERRLTYDSEFSTSPVIAVDSGNNTHIVWMDERDSGYIYYEIYYTKLDSNGDTLVDDKRLTHHLKGVAYPTIAIDSNNNVHITWSDWRDINPEIYYTKLDDNGGTLIDDKRLTYASAYSFGATIAVDSDNNVHISWYDLRDGGLNYEIYYTKLDNNGNTLVDDKRLTFDPARSCRPKIAIDFNDNVHITWDDDRDGNWEIYYTKLDNNGNTLVDDTRVTNALENSMSPEIVIGSNDNVHITWDDGRDGNTEIYYTKLDNNGNTLIDDTRLTTDPATSDYPSIAIDSDTNVHITWRDNRDGGMEIYYKHTISNPTVLISTDSFEYYTGDTMTVTLYIANPTKDSVTFQWYWGVPQYRIWDCVMSAPIPAGYDDTLDFSFTIPNWSPTPFGNVFYVHLLDASGEILDADVACWAYSLGGDVMPAAEVDITKEIRKTIEMIR